jgi:hypothetical protein
VSRPSLDLAALLEQARQLQTRLAEVRERLGLRTVEASAGGGAVTATANGRLELVRLRIDPRLVDPSDLEMLQDLVVAAVNEVLRRAQELAKRELEQATGLPLPGLLGGSG